MREMENRPLPCRACGSQVNGRESSMQTNKGILHECRWICPRCGCLVRVHEEYDNNEK